MELTRFPFKPVNRPTPSPFSSPANRFCAAVDHAVLNHQLPPHFKDDSISFLKLIINVLSGKTHVQRCRTAFQRFVSVVPNLPKTARDTMSDALIFYKPEPAISSYISQLSDALDERYQNDKEGTKMEQIKHLERCTAAAPRTRGDARIPAHQFADLPDLKAFLESDQVTTRLYGYRSIRDARDALEDLIPRLKPLEARFKEPEPKTKSLLPRPPKSFMYEALGKGKNAYIVIDKPCWEDRRDWNNYCESKDALQQARGELDVIRRNKRTSGF